MSNRLFCLSARVRSPSGLRHCLASAIRRLVPAAAFLATAPALPAAQELALFDAQDPRAAWTFDNGAEFPGAKGALRVREDVEPQFRPCLELQADFRGGGNYVQMGRPLPEADIEAVSFWLKAPADTRDITLRLVDGTDQCHQFVLGIEPHGRWQRIFFPVVHALEQAGKGAPLPMVRRYEGWGGARDGAWHNPGKGLYILSGRNVTGEAGTGSLLIAGARAVLAQPTTIVTREVRLDEFLQGGELDWGFNDGREFPGAKGGAALAEDVPEPGAYAVRLWGDFSEGGAYVSGEKRLGGLPVRAVRMRVRTENVRQINVRFGDGTGQCHQGRGIALTPDGAWHELVIPVADVVGGEHWGGANDGRWHGNAQYFSLILSAGSAADKKPELLIRDIRAEIETRMAVAGEPWSDGFEAGAAAWQVEGAGTAATELAAPYEGGACLRTARTEDDRNRAFRVLGPVFPAGAGRWNLSGAARPALYSPDNSFAVRLVALALDDAGALLEALPVADVTQGATWRTFAREIRFPAATAKARLAVEWHKTHGTCDFDALRATPVTEAEPDPIVDRIEIFSDVLGNLFYPEQPLTFHFRVRTLRPLPPAARTLRLTGAPPSARTAPTAPSASTPAPSRSTAMPSRWAAITSCACASTPTAMRRMMNTAALRAWRKPNPGNTTRIASLSPSATGTAASATISKSPPASGTASSGCGATPASAMSSLRATSGTPAPAPPKWSATAGRTSPRKNCATTPANSCVNTGATAWRASRSATNPTKTPPKSPKRCAPTGLRTKPPRRSARRSPSSPPPSLPSKPSSKPDSTNTATPSISTSTNRGGMCARACPTGAASGKPGSPYSIDAQKCISCGACYQACKFGAIVRQ